MGELHATQERWLGCENKRNYPEDTVKPDRKVDVDRKVKARRIEHRDLQKGQIGFFIRLYIWEKAGLN